MRILLIHTNYQFKGGEDVVFEQEYSLLKEIDNNIVEKICFQNKSGLKGLSQFLFSIWNISAAIKVKKKIKSFNPDIIHIHNWHFASGPIIIRTIKKKKIPLVLTLHNYRLVCPSATLLHNGSIYKESLNSYFPWRAVKDKVYRNSFLQTFWLAFIVWFHKIMGTWNKPDKYIALTSFAKELYIKSSINIPESKYVIKPNFTEPESFIKPEIENTSNYLFIGRLSEEKGIGYMIEAFKESGYNLYIAGDGPLKRDIIAICNAYPNIKYLGKLSKSEIALNLQKSSALIFPSICYESFGLTIIEAFSYAIPVIASNIGSIPFIVKDEFNGLLFKSGETEDLLVKLREWEKKEDSEKNIFSKNAYNTYLEKYSPEINKKILLNIYQDIINHDTSLC